MIIQLRCVTMWVIVTVVTVVVLVATYVTWTAARVDRLHARAAAASSALDAHLVRRAVAAAELGEARGLAELQKVAKATLAAPVGEREPAENDLTRVLRKQDLDPDNATDTAVVAASRRVALARQVHTDLVRDALAVRGRPLVRLFRMTRRHPRPSYFDIDDPTVILL